MGKLGYLIKSFLFAEKTAENLYQLATSQLEQGNLSAAIASYQQAIALKPDYAEAYSKLGIALREQKQLKAAVESFQQALRLNPELVEAYYKLGTVFEAQGQYEAAIKAYQNAISLEPDHADAHYNLGNLQMMQGKLVAAAASYQQAVVIKPDFAYAHCNLGSALAELGQTNLAIASYKQALLYIPEDGEVHFNLALLLLAQGEYQEGWQEHEYRYHPSVNNPNVRVPALSFPQWQGQPLKGKSIVIWYEQGLGDTIQFSRYAAMLKQQQAATVTLVCDSSLKLLFESLTGVDKILTTTEASAITPHDYWTFPLSIPLHCHTTLATIPAVVPYLAASAQAIEQWQTKLPEGKMRIGLIWKGSTGHKNDGNRSIPTLQLLAPLWNITGCRFISLQKVLAEAEIADFSVHYPVTHLGTELNNFADTAAIIAQLDLVITVDTSVAHLAGALGKPVWLLLPYVADWRWLESREDSPWYPTMKLFRQARLGDWEEVINRVVVQLKAVIGGNTPLK